ncbi:hypothetical protein BAE44_0019023 [Dichanthelium oligosanthes]|uniref:Uncharacterized protein n=1 Tax=Dichanthelium oligosanthes TaxID=888268 RepID=A0A1E5V472_9POAL|nr:hypothetical protein BAE44_0019023 [Dichanthelium oligosanthes]
MGQGRSVTPSIRTGFDILRAQMAAFQLGLCTTLNMLRAVGD